MRKGWILFVSALFLFGLTGCGIGDNAGDNANNDAEPIRVGNNNDNNGNNNNNDNNERVRVSDRASRNIERMKEVDQAQVFLVNNNAYVAVRLADDANNGGGAGGNNGEAGNNNGGENGNNAANGTEDGVIQDTRGGTANNLAENGAIDGNGDAGNNGNDQGNNQGIGQGDGQGTGNEASNNVNIQQDNYGPVDSPLDQKIADQVRAADRNVHRVYLSTNPDFYDTLTGYADDIEGGGNDAGLFEDFNNTVRGLFDD
ncbi:hypothetical protein CVD25_07245 [Bacillus canaveralius]|uniref:Sporulation protein n=1 Tax=Bacillus canaveralius TaxID=1403243 RepID=A0A2N5GHC6_9BACI|nr:MULTISPECIES: YhcN/YlaJ family sporulation lipoprotein [Bacillus]PLR80156.1 hypothetical protein CU635_19290 [Bacillus canaveralius]PLR83824.1 hypothetical protein CVD23_13150 [Bacillus sp. V33-4]PLR98702.1 hypothetical protein CVD25_07245 [Bacillus canaveralius]